MKKIASLLAIIALALLASCGQKTEINTVEVDPTIPVSEESANEEASESKDEEVNETTVESTDSTASETTTSDTTVESTVEADSVMLPPVAPIESEIEITTSDK